MLRSARTRRHPLWVAALTFNEYFSCADGDVNVGSRSHRRRLGNYWLGHCIPSPFYWCSGREEGLRAAETGNYIPAMTETELRVLRDLSDHRGAGEATLFSPTLGVTGDAHLPRDMGVNPREAAPGIAHCLNPLRHPL